MQIYIALKKNLTYNHKVYNSESIIANFPGTPRESQITVINNICNIFNISQ